MCLKCEIGSHNSQNKQAPCYYCASIVYVDFSHINYVLSTCYGNLGYLANIMNANKGNKVGK